MWMIVWREVPWKWGDQMGTTAADLSAERSGDMALETHFGYRIGRSEVVGKGDSMHEAHVSGLRNYVNRGVFNRDMETAGREASFGRENPEFRLGHIR